MAAHHHLPPRAQARKEAGLVVDVDVSTFSMNENGCVIVENDQHSSIEMSSPLALTSDCIGNVLYENPYFCKKKQKNEKEKHFDKNFSYKNSVEYRALMNQFSSGVTLPELFSIATIISSNLLLGLNRPGREEQRSFPLLIEWYQKNWPSICPVLPFIQLRDKNDQVINGRREIIEKCLK